MLKRIVQYNRDAGGDPHPDFLHKWNAWGVQFQISFTAESCRRCEQSIRDMIRYGSGMRNGQRRIQYRRL